MGHGAPLILALTVLALGGCGQNHAAMVDAGADGHSQGGPRPDNQLTPEPADLATAVGVDVVPSLRIDKYGLPIAEELVEAIVDSARLRTWPELEEVPATAVAEAAGSDWEPAVVVNLTPASALEDRWHVFVWQVPEAFDEPVRAFGTTTLADRSMGVRLRPGSHPVPVNLQVCEKQDGRTVVYLGTSELVVADAPLANILSAGPAGAAAASCTGAQEPPSTGLDTVGIFCTALPLSAPIEVVIGSGLRSPTGVALTTLDGSAPPMAVTLNGIPPNAPPGCWAKSLP